MKYFRLTSGLLPRLFLLLLLAAGLAACNKEDKPVGPDSDELATVKLSLADVEMRAGDLYSGEDLIKKVRIYVFREGAGGLLVVDNQKLYTSGETDFTNPFTISAHAGLRQVYVIANEPDALKTQLDRVVFKHELDALQLPVMEASVAQPFTMTGMAEATLDPNNTVTATVSLVRAVAKITLDIKQATSTDDQVKIVGVSILRNAKNSTLLQGTAKPTALWDWSATPAPALQLVNNGDLQDLIPDATPLYVYENLGSVADTAGRATQLVVEALYNGVKTRYYGYVNDATTATDHHFSIHRNHHYKLSGTITKMGEFSSLLLTTQVLPWTVEQLHEDFLRPIATSLNPANAFSPQAQNYATYGSTAFVLQIGIKGAPGSKWQATLTNGLEFALEEAGGAVTEGNADGTVYTVKVKATKPATGNERKTMLYFTVDGKKVVLNPNETDHQVTITVTQKASII